MVNITVLPWHPEARLLFSLRIFLRKQAPQDRDSLDQKQSEALIIILMSTWSYR